MHLLSVFSLRNRALIALVTIVVGVFGGIALTSLKQELIPSVTFPQLVVVTSYPGASPDVVEEDVSTPIETAIQSVQGLNGTTATSSSGSSTVSATFDYGTDITRIEQRVQLAINRIGGQLPDAVDPQVITGSIEDLPVIQVAVTSDADSDELSALLEDSTITELEQLDDVREVSLLGTTGKRLEIRPDLDELADAGLTTQAIRDALQQNGALLAAGEITEDGSTLTVQAGSRLESAKDVERLPLLGATSGGAASGAGSGAGADAGADAGAGAGAGAAAPDAAAPSAPVAPAVPEPSTIGEVAEVSVADDPVTGISRVNGEPALTIAVTKTPDGNTVDVSHEVRELLPELADGLGQGTEFTVVFDQAPFIEQSIEALATEGALGLAFAVVVILVFLLSIRSTLVTAISIPASVLITFIGMLATGYTLNILTLGALTIAIGRVVDDSIVVIENIKRHIGLGEEKLPAIQAAVKEVAAAITASTVTTVAVFLPLALVGDITGELFRPFALTVTIALAASLFVSLTIVPVLAYWFLGAKKVHRHDGDAAPVAAAGSAEEVDELDRPTRLQRVYLPVLRGTLKLPAVTLLAALLVLVGSGALATQLTTNFIGDSGQNTLTVTQTLPADTSLDATDEAAQVVEDALLEVDGVDTVQLSIGTSGSGVAAAFGGGGDVTYSITTDADADQTALQADVREAVAGLDDVGEVSVAASGSGFASTDIEIDITAPTADALESGAQDVLDAVRDLDVTAEAESNLSSVQPYLAIEIDREEAADRGLSDMQVGGLVAEAMLPSAIGSVQIDGDTLDVYIDDPDSPTTLRELRAFEIPTATGDSVRLRDIATVEQVDGPSTITTVQGVRSATVTITPSTEDLTTASAEVTQALDAVDLPAGATAEIGGVTADQADAFGQLGLALLAAILIVYTVMVATFRSLRQPLLLLISVPFAATGAIILQVISGIPLGVASLIGVLMLIGIVVTNAIVLIDLVNQYRERGMDTREAIVHGSARRLRPILMTALATIFALIPMAVGLTGHGGFISQPLAIVVIGGLVSSTVLTLIVLPSLYWLVEGARERRQTRRDAKAARRAEAERGSETPAM
ncbi:efflux RND transporter permease subunit [Homoserinibacter sp. YIM 151385]|uniref:efflux RND transporter permease subunit n=1 Tax=Homoserinibacter sp. YIM 151385 TaxID=2985506 RepID=UPI0022F096F5|nr:efflux RND transporter permease subunit [Homoserinibacter sp. YIM 151385]WBU37417.1 efflux RND transporter permease subunit [Homoserinibacter sp. YIM 151385]